MKAVLVVAAILALLFCLGWMSFASNDGNPSVTIDTEQVKEDTATAVQKGKDIVVEGIDNLKAATSDDTNQEVNPDSSQREREFSGNEVLPTEP